MTRKALTREQVRAQVWLAAAEVLQLRPADLDALTVAEFDAMVEYLRARG